MPKKKNYWTTTKAIERAKSIGVEVSVPTLIKWCEKYNLGFQLGGKGGKWYIYPEKYMRFIHGGKVKTDKNENPGSGTTGTEVGPTSSADETPDK